MDREARGAMGREGLDVGCELGRQTPDEKSCSHLEESEANVTVDDIDANCTFLLTG